MNVTGLDSVIAPLGWTLVHFLWQGLLVGLLHEAALRSSARRSPQLRYAVSLVALLVLLCAPIVTFALLWTTPAAAPYTSSASATLPAVTVTAGETVSLASLVEAGLPYVVMLWLAGVVMLTARFGAGLYGLRQLARHADFEAVSETVVREMERLADRMGIRRGLRIALSTRVASPLVVGWLRPVIYLPLSAATGLDHQQLRMVLAHELAHLRRHDHVVNLLQIAAETLLFYHPVVHRVSASLRQEREQCCDDMAAAIGGDAFAYARVLARLEEMRQTERRHALALGIAEQELYMRIQRLVGVTPSGTSPDRWLPVMLIMLAMAAALARTPGGVAPLLPDLFDNGPVARQRIALDLPPAVSRPFTPIVAPRTETDAAPAVTTRIKQTSSPPTETKREQHSAKPVQDDVKRKRDEPAASVVVAVDATPAPAATSDQAVDEPASGGELLHAERPVYPRAALRAGTEGDVLVEFTITAEGVVTDVEVLDAEPRRMFENAAVAAIKQWRYRPFVENGEAVARRATQVIEFRLTDDPRPRYGTPNGECNERTGTRLCRSEQTQTELRVLRD